MFKGWDADGHVEESEVTFSDPYWGGELRERRPFVIETDDKGSLAWVVDSRLFPRRYGPFQQFGRTPASKNGVPAPHHLAKKNDPIESAELRSAEARVAQLDREDMVMQVNYPTMFLSWPLSHDPRVGGAMARSYNNWIAEVSRPSEERLKWVTVIDPGDPKAAAAEIYRTKDMGSAGVMLLGTVGNKHLDDPSLEPVWAAAAETSLPVSVHVGFSNPALGDMYDTLSDATTIPFVFSLMMGLQRIISKGILDRYPDLRVAILEGGCQWVPFLMERMEEYSGKPGVRGGPREGYTGELLPAEYVARGQVYFGFEVEDKLLPFVVEEFGEDCWLFASDIPHADRQMGVVRTLQERPDLSESAKRKMLIDNVARFYGLPIPAPQPVGG